MTRRGSTALFLVVAATFAAPQEASAATGDVVRLTAGRTAFTDAAKQRWRPAGKALDGRRVRTSRVVEKTASQRLYGVVAEGAGRASIRVGRPGLYAVTLYLVEPAAAGRRRAFRVISATSRRTVEVLQGDDEALPTHSTLETRVRGRVLRLRFTPLSRRTAIAAIEVQRLGPVDAPPVRLRWHETFDEPAGTRPSPARWTYAQGGRFGATQLQAYTDSPRNVSTDGEGNLVITARREHHRDGAGNTTEYTSARIESIATYSLRRARVQARIRTPEPPGLWPALWARGVEPPSWPDSGEVDIMELNTSERGELLAFVHGPLPSDPSGYYPGSSRLVRGTPLSDGMHTYGMRSEPGVVEFLFNGDRFGSVSRADIPAGAPWLVDRRYHIVLNVAVGGWLGPPPPGTPFPATMTVGDLRLWR